MTSFALPAIPQDGGLRKYLRDIQAFPMLEQQEEVALAKRWREHDDTESAHKLVTSHLRLVAKIARGYRGYGLPLADLISEGNVGLMRAVKGFDPERGFRLATYAMWWIRAAITEYVLRSWSIVKIGTVAAQKKLFFGLRKIKDRLKIIDAGELSPEQTARIAEAMDVPEEDVTIMNRRFLAGDASLNVPLTGEDATEHLDLLVDDREDQETLLQKSEEGQLHRRMLNRALATLKDRERHIITERRLKEEPSTLESLAKIYSISRERVRQIEVRAFEKLREAMLEDLPESGATTLL
ncbi:MAG TPA: RNA polymerase sigma factor RpoH [Alphaproteobacteria bacterium]|jgi:RNA polymerase sigma-32 factor|nr:RNA polymerase sigma factor RpoH [Alphaproteobacteria bacterium]HJO89413.1 RNA polymerase sigma factor RpoH [Alphaproteobacteria bacterium]|tara:strand:+ start:111 stop:998 length:888 start_codon:yes stop_codon:yes gene_type:complete